MGVLSKYGGANMVFIQQYVYVQLVCTNCSKQFTRLNDSHMRRNKTGNFFCSCDCDNQYRNKKRTSISCHLCNKSCYKKPAEIKKSKTALFFCSRSCKSKYYHKGKLLQPRSKIETAFGERLQQIFPELEFKFNDRKILNGLELDIYLPKLNLAIEWNGHMHFFPVYGEEKLQKTQYNDYKKQLLCQKLNIDLIIITDYHSKGSILEDSVKQVSEIINLKLNQM